MGLDPRAHRMELSVRRRLFLIRVTFMPEIFCRWEFGDRIFRGVRYQIDADRCCTSSGRRNLTRTSRRFHHTRKLPLLQERIKFAI